MHPPPPSSSPNSDFDFFISLLLPFSLHVKLRMPRASRLFYCPVNVVVLLFVLAAVISDVLLLQITLITTVPVPAYSAL
jgi:hypothetical protein